MELKIDIQAVRNVQDGKFLSVQVFDTKRGQFQFIKNRAYTNCSIVDLVSALAAADELKNVCLIGALTLLNIAGLKTEMLRAKGAIVDLEAFVAFAKTAVREYKHSDKNTLKVIGITIDKILTQWSDGLLAQCNQALNHELNVRALNIMVREWHQSKKLTNVELVDILRKRITRHVQNETCAYLGAIAIREDKRGKVVAQKDEYAAIVGDINYHHKLSDVVRSCYRGKIEAKMHSNFFSQTDGKSDINKTIKKIRDLLVMERYQTGNKISESLCAKLDTDLSDRILSAIRVDHAKFKKESPQLSRHICLEAAALLNDMAVDSMTEFNAIVVSKLISEFKLDRIPTDVKRQLISYLMPLVEKLKFENEEKDNKLIHEAVENVVSNPAQLVDYARAQFIDTVSNVIQSEVDASVKDSENASGRELLRVFCGEILVHLNCPKSSEIFKDPDQISALFNQEEVSLARIIEAKINPGQGMFNQVKTADQTEKVETLATTHEVEQSGPGL